MKVVVFVNWLLAMNKAGWVIAPCFDGEIDTLMFHADVHTAVIQVWQISGLILQYIEHGSVPSPYNYVTIEDIEDAVHGRPVGLKCYKCTPETLERVQTKCSACSKPLCEGCAIFKQGAVWWCTQDCLEANPPVSA